MAGAADAVSERRASEMSMGVQETQLSSARRSVISGGPMDYMVRLHSLANYSFDQQMKHNLSDLDEEDEEQMDEK